MEERIKKLEDAHAEAVNALKEVSYNTRAMSTVLDNHVKGEKSIETTMRNIDDNVNSIKLDMARLPHERAAHIDKRLDPVWDSIRKTNKEFNNFQLNAKDVHDQMIVDIIADIKKWVTNHIAVIWVGVGAVCALGAYIHVDQINQLRKDMGTHKTVTHK